MKIYNPSESVTLSLKLYDSDNTKFVRATVFQGTNIFGVYPLVVASLGLYVGQFPFGIGAYEVVYEVFSDAAFTNKSKKYTDAAESFRVDDLRDFIGTKTNEIIDTIDLGDGKAV